jgi:hypothetical protein
VWPHLSAHSRPRCVRSARQHDIVGVTVQRHPFVRQSFRRSTVTVSSAFVVRDAYCSNTGGATSITGVTSLTQARQ